MKSLLIILFLLPLTLLSQKDHGFSLYSVDAGVEQNRYRFDRFSLFPYASDKNELASTYPYFVYHPFYGSRSDSWNYYANTTFRTKWKHQYLGFGVNYTRYNYMWASSFIDQNQTVIDSFEMVSSGGSTQLYVDSLWTDFESLSFEQQAISANVDYQVRTKRTRIAGTFGAGVRLGMSINKNMDYRRWQSFRYRRVDENGMEVLVPAYQINAVGPIYDETIIDSQRKQIEAKSAFILAPYIPISFEYTPFIHREKLNSMAIELRGRAGYEFQFVKGADVHSRLFMSIGLGLKYFVGKAPSPI